MSTWIYDYYKGFKNFITLTLSLLLFTWYGMVMVVGWVLQWTITLLNCKLLMKTHRTTIFIRGWKLKALFSDLLVYMSPIGFFCLSFVDPMKRIILRWMFVQSISKKLSYEKILEPWSNNYKNIGI